MSFGFPAVTFPQLGDAVFLNYTDESEREKDQGIDWAIRHGDGEQLYEIHEGTYAYERNFMPEAIAIQALDYFLKTGDRDPSLSWESFEFYDPEWEEFCKGNDSK